MEPERVEAVPCAASRRGLHVVAGTRIMLWVVSFSSLGPFGRGLAATTASRRWRASGGTHASLYAIDATRDSRGVGQDIHKSSYAIDASTA